MWEQDSRAITTLNNWGDDAGARASATGNMVATGLPDVNDPEKGRMVLGGR
jgi:hypothetical protein